MSLQFPTKKRYSGFSINEGGVRTRVILSDSKNNVAIERNIMAEVKRKKAIEIIKNLKQGDKSAREIADLLMEDANKLSSLVFDGEEYDKMEKEAYQNLEGYIVLLKQNTNLDDEFIENVMTLVQKDALTIQETLKDIMEESKIAMDENGDDTVEEDKVSSVYKYVAYLLGAVAIGVLGYKVYRHFEPAPVEVKIDGTDLVDDDLISFL